MKLAILPNKHVQILIALMKLTQKNKRTWIGKFGFCHVEK